MCFIFARSHSTSAPFPPQLFVELNELIVKDHEMRWKERARWIKFEEDVEEETGRWGKAHVASLSFRSLLELRRTITHGKQLLHARSAADAPVYLCPCVINRTHTKKWTPENRFVYITKTYRYFPPRIFFKSQV